MSDRDGDTGAVIQRFNEAFNGHDIDGVMALMTDDCRFETTGPAPDGQVVLGQPAVRRCWEELFSGAPHAEFTTEEMFVADDRCVVRWRYDWGDGHVRGIDIFRVRDGKVDEKLCYVKG